MRPAVLLATLVLLAACSEPAEPPRVGETAPGFTLEAHDGARISLADFRGRWVVLYFYPSDFATGCTIQARGMEQDGAKFRERNAVVLGVSMDDTDSHRRFRDATGVSYPLLSDPDGTVSETYGSIRGAGSSRYSQRHTFVIDPNGTIQRVYLDVNPQTHSRSVLADLARFQGG